MLSEQTLSISPHGRIEFGAGSLQRLPDAVVGVGKHRVFLVTDPGIKACGVLAQVLDVLAAAGIETEVYDGVEPNPSTATIDAAAAQLRRFGDAAVVPVGGGSSLDAAKGISLAAVNGGQAADYDYRNEPKQPALPLIAVPTTAGTGAETNGFGVIENRAAHCKIYLGHASAQPVVSILDPILTVGLPSAATAATGLDALVHGIESLTSRSRNPLSEAYAHQAVRLVYRWLPAAVTDGTDLEARAQLLLGAHLAGLALSISGLGLVHGIAHAVSARTGAAHGLALGSVLDHVLAFNLVDATSAYAELSFDLGIACTDRQEEANAEAVAPACRAFAERVGAHTTLAGLGCDAAMVPDLARTALADAVTANNPRQPSQPELEALLLAALDG
ncbi:alcohol dehydrogenase class IV [Streptacidiphilus sp. MAP12-16]|uniref:iron-containing alcohol dehydrogenase n=1 Tax=Streptacidiphilus sp. MAP12-16 TaxID=3156300 RepID=UPI0035114E89